MPDDSDLIWYAAYGTNLSLDRLTCYLAGGTPAGAALACPGARDPSPPRAVVPVELAGSVYFAWESPTWGGGVAFLDPLADGVARGRAYLMTHQQLGDLAAQEMHRPPGTDLDAAVLSTLLSDGVVAVGPGRYETLHVVGRIDDAPVVTVTSPGRLADTAVAAPADAYVATMGRGLLEGWEALGVGGVASYLASCPGIGRDPVTIAELLGPHGPLGPLG